MRTLVLSGFMATGKSTVGPIVAERLGLPFADTDVEIAREAGMSVADLIRTGGEGNFRAAEAQAISRLVGGKPHVLAIGGGAMTVRATRRLLCERALVVTLTARPDTILARLGDPRARPLIDAPSTRDRVENLLEQRADAYGESHLTLATDGRAASDVAGLVISFAARDPVLVPLGRRSYCVDVVNDRPECLAEAISQCAPTQLLVVMDSNVRRARGAALEQVLGSVGAPITRVTLPAGEQHKNLASVSAIWDAGLGAGVDRNCLVLAFGGGVVGDLAAFAASALLRGVRCIQAPTTVLGMVDSSVGGKTGFDHPAGKNLIGSFHQPSAVVADIAHLSTLPAPDRRAGLAEAVKVALVADRLLFEELEAEAPRLAAAEAKVLEHVIRRAIGAKARIVSDDEREADARALLNLGHTVGHALEAFGGYTRYRHGEAVALGVLEELRIARNLGLGDTTLEARTAALLTALGLPTRLDRGELSAALPLIAGDKKRDGVALRFPVVAEVGKGTMQRVTLNAFRAAALV
jgi:shikimate kinase/3-dehydroquinate synthase